MIEAIGTRWGVNVLDVCAAYRNVFLLFLLGMIIHWLPTNWKRRYRLSFARLPLPLIGLAVLVTVFILYQFVTAEMQPFIYFQFYLATKRTEKITTRCISLSHAWDSSALAVVFAHACCSFCPCLLLSFAVLHFANRSKT